MADVTVQVVSTPQVAVEVVEHAGVDVVEITTPGSVQTVEVLQEGPPGARGPIGPKGFSIVNPDIAAPRFGFWLDREAEVVSIRSVLAGSNSPSVTFSIRYGADFSGAGTELVVGGITCTNTTTGLVSTVSGGVIPADRHVWCQVSAVSGFVDSLSVTVIFG